MTKIAIDVALIPSEEMMEKAIEINKELLKTNDDKIVLGKEQNLPHMTLCMGALEESDIPKVEKILSEIAPQFSALQLEVVSPALSEPVEGRKISYLKIETTEELQRLHEAVMKRMLPLLTYDDVTIEMVFHPPYPDAISLSWIKGYKEKSCFERFKPHITIGAGEIKDLKVPIKFTADRLILAHLGNYCTCRKVLASVELKHPPTL